MAAVRTPALPTVLPSVPRWADALTGTVAAGVALAAGELFAGFSDAVPSLVIAVGEAIIDHTPGDLVESGIQAAGTNDKPLLIAGIVVFSLVFGAVLGVVARRRPMVADAGFMAFGVVGGWAAARNPFTQAGWSWIAALVAAALGVAARRILLAVASLPAESVPNTSAGADFPARRTFL